jgi:hypothetical protein
MHGHCGFGQVEAFSRIKPAAKDCKIDDFGAIRVGELRKWDNISEINFAGSKLWAKERETVKTANQTKSWSAAIRGAGGTSWMTGASIAISAPELVS